MIDNDDEETPPEFIRSSWECICEKCNKNYYQHKQHEKYPWLRVLCNGTLVKL